MQYFKNYHSVTELFKRVIENRDEKEDPVFRSDRKTGYQGVKVPCISGSAWYPKGPLSPDASDQEKSKQTLESQSQESIYALDKVLN